MKTIIVSAVLLGLIGVAAIEIARRWRWPLSCPNCGGKIVHEWGGEYVCGTCHQRWQT